jgi:hypothetical protein
MQAGERTVRVAGSADAMAARTSSQAGPAKNRLGFKTASRECIASSFSNCAVCTCPGSFHAIRSLRRSRNNRGEYLVHLCMLNGGHTGHPRIADSFGWLVNSKNLVAFYIAQFLAYSAGPQYLDRFRVVIGSQAEVRSFVTGGEVASSRRNNPPLRSL